MNFWKYIKKEYLTFLVVVSLWYILFFATPDFFDNPIEGIQSYVSIFSYLIVLLVTAFPLIMLITVNKYISAIFLPLFGILGSIVAYYRVAYQTTVTVAIIDAVINTTIDEASSVMTTGLFLYVGLNMIISIGLVVWRFRIRELSKSTLLAICSFLCLLVVYNGNERIKTSIVQRYPYNIFYYGREYYEIMLKRTQPRELLPAEEISQTPDSLIVVFVLGESMRADHMSFNNYGKETTPLLKTEKNLISLGDVWTPHTNTGSAIPYILTPSTKDNLDWAITKESFIPYYKNKGFNTVWVSNQDMSNGYSYFIRSVDTVEFVNKRRSVWTFELWTDNDLIDPIKSYITEGKKQELIIVHTIGAHWYYNLHYPKEFMKFKPITTSRVVTDNKPEEVINSYDNCVSYMDYFVHSIITMLYHRNAIVIYQSDHGEALGEGGKWLHASDGEMMHHPAGFVWYSDKYKHLYPDNVRYIEELAKKNNDADYAFPLMLRLIGLQLPNDLQD